LDSQHQTSQQSLKGVTMGSAEKFCLRWNDFESNISGAFRDLREDKDFFDVTLACDDDQIQAHKVILSACSPFFRTILRRNKHDHPLLYLKGVKYAEIVSVLNFMYHGEVNVAQEELNSFLAVAEDLKIKGLTQNNADSKPKNIQTDLPKPQVKNTLSLPVPLKRPRQPSQVQRPPATSSKFYQQEDGYVHEVVPVKSEPITIPDNTASSMIEQSFTSDTIQQEQEGIVADPNMEYGEEYEDYSENYEGHDGYEGVVVAGGLESNKDLEDLVLGSMSSNPCGERGAMWQCNHCGKEDKDKNNMRRHVESHFNFKHTCPYCGNEFKSRPSMQSHISRKHKATV